MSHPVTQLKKEDVDAIPESLVPFIRKVMKVASRFNVWIYEKTDGKVGGKFVVGGAPVCLVSYTGRKSGKRLTTPLIHIPFEDGVLLVASQGGLEKDPLWFKNITAHPTIEVLGKHPFEEPAGLAASHGLEPRLAPRRLRAFDDEGAGLTVELVGVGGEEPERVRHERQRQAMKELRRAEPDVLIAPLRNLWLKEIDVRSAHQAVGAVGTHQQVGRRQRREIGNWMVEPQIDTNL